MINEAVKYYSLNELWNGIKKLPEKRRYIAGGSDMVISHHYDDVDADALVDISDIKELRVIKESRNSVFIGAGVRISELAESSIIKKHIPALYKCVDFYASPSVRNIATLGGNLVNSSPCADGVLALVASGAMVMTNLYGRRKISEISDIVVGPKKTSLKTDELVEGFIVPEWEHEAAFFKMMPRKIFGISKAGLCVCADVKKYSFKKIRISVSSVGPVIINCHKTEGFLVGKKITDELVEQAKEIIRDEISPIDDHRSTADYRSEIIGVFLERAVKSLSVKYS
jgi:CO/xanthine dehydrogenase FAD-binding subunit